MVQPSDSTFLVFILGAPGAGKGTICQKLSQEFGLYHLSIGDYMREISREPTFNNIETITECLQQGKLLPTDIVLPILQEKIDNEKKKGYHEFLIDGFPRQMAQALEFERQIGTPAFVIYFQCPQDIARQRYLSRRLPGRLLDDEKMFEDRFEEFSRENSVIVEYYQSEGKLEVVDSSSETKVTYERLLATMGGNHEWKNRVIH